MDFKEFLPTDKYEKEVEQEDIEIIEEKLQEKIGQEQFYDVITSKKPDWQQIIYELINSEQLDPWDIDLVLLTRKYFERIQVLEDNDFYISSKVLLAACLLLRIKSEFLLNKHIKNIDEILFGKKEDKKLVFERIEINEDDLPLLIPKTPLPRARRVTLIELMNALNKAINTESRRIKREVAIKRARKLSEVDFPEFRRIDLKDRIKRIYAKILTTIKKTSNKPEKELNKVAYTNLAGNDRIERLSCFLPILHLSNSKKLWLEQEYHLQEIYIYLYDYFDKNRDKFIEELEDDIEAMKEELEAGEMLNEEEIASEDRKKEIIGEIEKAILDVEEAQKLSKEEIDEVESEVKEEIKELDKEKKIEKASGFSDEN